MVLAGLYMPDFVPVFGLTTLAGGAVQASIEKNARRATKEFRIMVCDSLRYNDKGIYFLLFLMKLSFQEPAGEMKTVS